MYLLITTIGLPLDTDCLFTGRIIYHCLFTGCKIYWLLIHRLLLYSVVEISLVEKCRRLKFPSHQLKNLNGFVSRLSLAKTSTLEYGMDLGQGINVGPGKFGKNNKCT